ncbi:DUF5403 family protein [Streptomyces sp. NPDC048057]|uniref:DUF5403 family protein n=1 Tax=Streptomyces sp. NPDC048057 TaxID=3155628 RepID=UPI0033D1D11C
MAYIYKGVDGKKMSEVIASLPEVQDEIWERTFEIAARAEALLVQHRVEGVAKIDMAKGDIDAYVVLEDRNATNVRKSNNSAASIELGRGGYTVEVVNERGQVVNEYEVAPAEGLHILAEASRLPKRSRGLRAATEKRIKIKRRKRNGRRS